MQDRPPIRIVAGSPDRLVIEGIMYGRTHTHELELVGYAPTMPAFRQVLATTSSDIVLVNAPVFGGVAVLHELVTQYPERVIMIGKVMAYTAALMHVGAPGYITTDDSSVEAAHVIRAVAGGEGARSPLADACWQWYLVHGDTPTPVQAALARHRDEYTRSA